MANSSTSTSSLRRTSQGPIVCINGHSSEPKNSDSFCPLRIELSDDDSEEELGTAVEAYYQKPRRVGFDAADSDPMDIFERLRTCHRTRSLSACLTTPALAGPSDRWNTELSIEQSDDTCSVYFDAGEFLKIDAIPSEAACCDARLNAFAIRQTKDEPADGTAADTFELGLPHCPVCDIGDHPGVSASGQESDSDLKGVKKLFFEVTPVVLGIQHYGTGKRARKKLQRRMRIDEIRPEKSTKQPETTKRKMFWGKLRKTWSKTAS